MPVTFHSPPSWPAAPAGFIPPAGWQPEPSWAQAPSGWVFYTDNGVAVPPPAGAWQPPTIVPPAASPPAPTPAPGSFASPTPHGAAPPVDSSPAPSASPPQGWPPAQPGTAATAYAPAGAGFGQPLPPPKKSRLGLVIGLGAGVLVLVVAVAVVAFVLLANSAPTLTSAQFDTVFDEGRDVLGRSVGARSTGTPTATTSTDACQVAINTIVRTGDDWFYATTSDDELLFSGTRFADRAAAGVPYEAAESACTKTGVGTVNGARWFSVNIEDTDAVVLNYGNVSILGAARESDEVDMSDLADAIQAEISAAAKR
ncbi:hypothetical protein [Propionicicella superfundia]|uniref:hypothetical protein n=1 Tax=Propionicicella superfundia TaxID=348582 RepID=UPI0003F8393B|nr:hypothetical protein [Propionicicella superfundia]